MSAPKLKWEKPPAGRRSGGSSRIDAEVAQLKKRPGSWAKIREAAPSGNYITYRKRGAMTRVSGVGDNRYDIWCIWFGTPEEPTQVTAESLEPTVKVEYKDGTAIVKEVAEAGEGKVIVHLSVGAKTKRVKVDRDYTFTALGVGSE